MTTGFRYRYSKSLGNVPGFRYKRLPGERRDLAALVVDRERRQGDFVRLIETNRRRKLYWPYEAESPQEVGKMQKSRAEKVSTSKSSSEKTASEKNYRKEQEQVLGILSEWYGHPTESEGSLMFTRGDVDVRVLDKNKPGILTVLSPVPKWLPGGYDFFFNRYERKNGKLYLWDELDDSGGKTTRQLLILTPTSVERKHGNPLELIGREEKNSGNSSPKRGAIPSWMNHFTEPEDHSALFFVNDEKDDRLIELEDKLKSKEKKDPRLYRNGRKAIKLRFEYYAIRENGENRFYIAPNLEGAEALQKLGVPVSDYTISVKGITFNEPGMFGDTEPIDVLVWPLSLKGKPLEPTEPFVVPASEKTASEHASFRNKTTVSHKVKSGGKKSYMALISGTDELYGLNRKFLQTHKDQSTMELKEDFPLGSIIEEDTKLTPRRYFIVTREGLKLIGEGKEGASIAKRIMRKREK